MALPVGPFLLHQSNDLLLAGHMYKHYFLSGSIRDKVRYHGGHVFMVSNPAVEYPVLDVLPGGKIVIKRGNRTIYGWPYPKYPFKSEYQRRYKRRLLRPIGKPRGEYWKLRK